MKNRQNNIIPVEAVKYYLSNGSLRKTAKELNIHYQTLFKWVRMHKMLKNTKCGFSGSERKTIKEKLLTGYRRPWNRTSYELEEKIILMKEKDPALTLRKAKEILEKQGIKISIKGIWGVWKRAGLSGFMKSKSPNNFTEYISWSKEARIKFEHAKKAFSENKIKESAVILNSIPALPRNELIKKIS